MTFHNVITCGCSYLFGIGCYEQHNILGKLMAKKLNAKYTDLSLCGGSNDRIVRKIVDWAIENKDELKNTLFVIGMTEPSRYESWDELLQSYGQGSASGGPETKDDPYELLGIDYPHDRGSELDLHRGGKYQLLTKVQRMYYKYLHSNKSDLDRTLRNIILLTSFFEKHGSKYLIFNSIGDLKKMSKGHQFFGEVFNNKNYYSDETWRDSLFPRGRGMIAAEDKRFDDSTDWGHPSQKSHKLWFKKLYKHGEEIGLWKE